MKKVARDGQIVLIPRSVANINVYEDDGKTIRSNFNQEDWNDIHTGLALKIKHYRKKGVYAYSNAHMRDFAIEQSLKKLSPDRVIRIAILALQALVPDKCRIDLFHSQLCDNDHILPKTKKTTFEDLLQLGNHETVDRWFDHAQRFIWSWLRPVFEAIQRNSDQTDQSGWRLHYVMPPILSALIDQLKEQAKQLPVYQIDFKGTIIDGEIYHEPLPAHESHLFTEARWRGGFHVNFGDISAGQIKKQGGSFGPICLFYLEYLEKMVPFRQSAEKEIDKK